MLLRNFRSNSTSKERNYRRKMEQVSMGDGSKKRVAQTSANDLEQKHAFSSGATSSQKVTRYDLCFFQFFERVANIFRYGADKHGDVNYQKAIFRKDGKLTLDVAFVRDRFNHGFKHYTNLKTGEEPDKDNIGAVGWALSFLAWVESHGFPLNRILNPRYVDEVFFIKGEKNLLVETKTGTIYIE